MIDAELFDRAVLEQRRRQERLRAVRAVVGVVLLKSIRVAYTFRQCSPQRTIVSAAAGVVRCDAVHRHAFPCRAGCCLKVPPNLQPIGPPDPGCSPPARAVKKHPRLHASSCASITQSTFVDHSTPPQVPQYCIPDTLAFKTSLSPLISGLHRAAPFFEPCHVSHLVRVHHPCLSPHGTLSFSQVPACRRQRTVRDGRSSLRYSKPEKRFRMPAALLYTKSSFPGNVSIMVSVQLGQPAFPSPSYLRSTQRCIIMFHAVSRAPSHSKILQLLFPPASMS